MSEGMQDAGRQHTQFFGPMSSPGVFSPERGNFQPSTPGPGSGFASHTNIEGIKNNQIIEQSRNRQKIVGMFKQ